MTPDLKNCVDTYESDVQMNTFSFQNINSGMCLDLNADSLASPAVVVQCHSTENFKLPLENASITEFSVSALPSPTLANFENQGVIPSNKTLIQSNTYASKHSPVCWEVSVTGKIIGATCSQSNPSQWWSRSFSQLVYTDPAGATHCAGVGNRHAGTQLQAGWCGSDASQSFLFGTDGTIRLASTYLCVGVNNTGLSSGLDISIEQEICQSGLTIYQSFSPSQPSVIFPELISSQCEKQNIRKEWRDLTTQERTAYIAAVDGVRKLPSTAGRSSYYDDLVAVHAGVIDYIHTAPVFWPWHRNYVRLFEDALQQVDPSVSLPYWDWGFDGDAPLSNTDIFGPNNLQFGTRGDPNSLYPACLKDGFAKNWISDLNQCTSRNYTLDVMVNDDSGIMPMILSSNDFSVFAKAMEAAHNIVHFYIGGITGDLYYIDMSTNDPLFFLHHANVDRYWNLWQYHHNNLSLRYDGIADLPPGSNNQYNVQDTDLMPGINLPVSFALQLDSGNGFCARYIPYSKSSFSISVSDEPPIRRDSELEVTQYNLKIRRNAELSVPDGWEMYSPYYLRAFDEQSMVAMERMFVRLREGEKILSEISAKFFDEVNKHVDKYANHTLDEAKLFVLRKMKALLM
ncbi:hypothetical protein HK100_000505 [Physocladia obscura]|uniref:Tyrosinase copper-binding domain-containing protein n=1 Tax=Physocladia obscura TaxID=109957 RepID=A0AAD5T9G3_9FUNG|nr:hypothetical protein HK100_000505 [Physocladia obscura]